jgi:hypothetical protein
MDISKDGKAIRLEMVFAESASQKAIDAIIGTAKPTQLARAKGIKLSAGLIPKLPR